MINGDRNYFYHQGRYPEDDGLFFVGVDKKRKQCLYAKIGDDVSDYFSYDLRVMLAKCLAFGVAVALFCGMFFYFSLEPKWWLLAVVLGACSLLCVVGYFKLVKQAKKLRRKSMEKMVKMYYEI